MDVVNVRMNVNGWCTRRSGETMLQVINPVLFCYIRTKRITSGQTAVKRFVMTKN